MLWKNNYFSVQVALVALLMVLLDWLIRYVFYYSSSMTTCVVLVDFKVIAHGVPPSKTFRKKTKQRERLQMAFNGSGSPDKDQM